LREIARHCPLGVGLRRRFACELPAGQRDLSGVFQQQRARVGHPAAMPKLRPNGLSLRLTTRCHNL
jgi:hypothetical protein